MTTKHTPPPWQINPFNSSQICDRDVSGRGCMTLASMRGGTKVERQANAAVIVRAVNAHDDLVAALQAIASDENIMSTTTWARTIARAALAKAKGE